MKKIVFGVIGLVLFAVVAFLGYHFVKGVLRGMQVPTDLAARTWVEHKLIPDTLSIDVPWPLKAKASPTATGPTGSDIFTTESDGLVVLCKFGHVGVSTSENLDAAVERVLAYTKGRSGVEIVSQTKTPTSVMGVPAMELQMEIKEKWKLQSQFRGLYFIFNGNFCQINCNSGLNQPVASEVWERMKKSIRPAPGFVAGPKTGISRGTLPLPPGFKRRTE